jgi:hypothetical protein
MQSNNREWVPLLSNQSPYAFAEPPKERIAKELRKRSPRMPSSLCEKYTRHGPSNIHKASPGPGPKEERKMERKEKEEHPRLSALLKPQA